jgi:hypothetical protein
VYRYAQALQQLLGFSSTQVWLRVRYAQALEQVVGDEALGVRGWVWGFRRLQQERLQALIPKPETPNHKP